MAKHVKLTRRHLLKGVGLGSAAVLVASCAPAPALTPTPPPAAPTAAPPPAAPTATPKPSAPAAPTPTVVPATPKPVAKKVGVRVYSNWTAGARGEYMKWLKATFEGENPDIAVELEFAPGAEFLDRLYTSIAGNTMPDLAMMWGRDACKFIGKGAFLDITPYLRAQKFSWELYLKSDMNMFEYQGKTYGLPHMYTTPILAANMALFGKTGIPYPKDDWNWNDFLQIAKALTKEGQWGYQGPLVGGNPAETWSYWVWSNGGEILSEDKTKSLWDMPETIEAIRFVTDLRTKHKVMPSEGDLKAMAGVGIDPFIGGKVGMFYGNVGWFGSWLTQIKDWEWDLLPFPLSLKGKRVVWHSQSGYYIAHNTKHPEEAFKLLAFITGEKANRQLGVTRATMPSVKAAAYDEAGWLKPPPKHIRLSVDVIAYGRPQPWAFPQAVEWYAVSTKELDQVAIGEKSAEEACKAAAREGDRVLRK